MNDNSSKLQALSTSSVLDPECAKICSDKCEFKLSTVEELMAIPRGTTMGLVSIHFFFKILTFLVKLVELLRSVFHRLLNVLCCCRASQENFLRLRNGLEQSTQQLIYLNAILER